MAATRQVSPWLRSSVTRRWPNIDSNLSLPLRSSIMEQTACRNMIYNSRKGEQLLRVKPRLCRVSTRSGVSPSQVCTSLQINVQDCSRLYKGPLIYTLLLYSCTSENVTKISLTSIYMYKTLLCLSLIPFWRNELKQF